MKNAVEPKKHWGQNFLDDESVVSRIIAAAGLDSGSCVLEVGPGTGALTESLLGQAGKVVSIEIDRDLSALLKKRFAEKDNFSLIQDDILRINLPELIGREFQDKPYRVIANIPYYITSPIIRLFLETETRPQELLLMVQKEVAERIVAIPGKMSLLAVSVQYYAVPELLFPVPKESFRPIPEVDSAIIRIRPYEKRPERESSRRFFRIAKAGFSAKRKTLLNNLSSGLHLDRDLAEKLLLETGIDPQRRAQELSLEEWSRLSENIAKDERKRA